MSETSNPYLSIVIPLFNEEEVLPKLLQELSAVCNSLGQSYEIILVDDGSNDRTQFLLKEAAVQNNHLKVLRFSRNFGHQAAFNAGIDFSQGEVVITMDGDLQHPPSLIPEFIKYARAGSDIVIGERTANRQNSWLREIIGKIIYKILSAMSGLQFKNSSDFALYNRQVVSVLKQLPEKERFLRGIVQWVGFKKYYVPYAVQARQAGRAKYNLKRLTSLVLSGATSFSAAPLRLAFWAGLLVLVASIGFSVYVIWDHYTRPNPLIAGWATLVILFLFLGSIQLIVLGVIGEYLYKIFYEVKGRPLYIISETINVDREQVEHSPYGISNF
ncbi:MAG: glycosyltransferase family 2 protein [Patescibacteria group bacterium]